MLKITTAMILISFLASCQMVKLREKRHGRQNLTRQENRSNNLTTKNTNSKDKSDSLTIENDKSDDKKIENKNNDGKLVFFKKTKAPKGETKKDETNITKKEITQPKEIKDNSFKISNDTKTKNSKEIKSNSSINTPKNLKPNAPKDLKSEDSSKNIPKVKSLKDYKTQPVKTEVVENKKLDFNNSSIKVYNPKEEKKEVYLKSNNVDMSKKIDITRRAVTLRIDTMTNWIMPNDKIDVIAIFNSRTNKKMATTLVEDILVLAVGDYTSENLKRSEKKKIYYNNITLSLSLKQAEVLILAQEQGKLYFILRNDSNSKKESDGKKIIINNGR